MSYIAYSGTVYTTEPGTIQGDQQAAKSSIRNADGSVATAPTPIISNHPQKRPINLADRGVSHLNAATVNTPLIQQALTDAQTAGTGVVFPQVPDGQWIDINAPLAVPTGGITIQGDGVPSRIRQTVLPQPVLEISGPDVTVSNLHVAGASFDYTGQSTSFRGETIQVYATGVWVSASRVSIDHLTVEAMVCAVHHSNWDATTNAEGPPLTDCAIDGLLVVGCNFGIVPRGVVGFSCRGLRGTYTQLPGCSLSPHLVYFTTGAVVNQNVTLADSYAMYSGTAYNGYYAYQVKNTTGGVFSNLLAEGCPGLLHVMSSQDVQFDNLQSTNDLATDTMAGCVSLEGTNTRVKMRGVTVVQAAGGGMAVWTDGTDTDTLLADAQIVCNHTVAGPAAVYDVSMRGTNPVVDNVAVSNVGTATFDSAIGVFGGINCDIRNPRCSGEKRAVTMKSGASGVTVVYDPARLSIDPTTGVIAIDDGTGTANLMPLDAPGVWQTYSPGVTGTGATLGNATVVAWYTKIGQTVHFRIRVTRGSTTTWGTQHIGFGLPTVAKTDTDPLASGKLFRTGVNSYALWCVLDGTGGYVIPMTFGTGGVGAYITDTAPAAAVTGDYIDVHGTYQSAS